MSEIESGVDIGEVVRRSGLPASTLHFWERHGLLSPVGRDGLRRQYAEDVLDQIATILLFQRGGFRLAEIKTIVAPGAFDNGKDQIAAKLEELRSQKAELETAIDGLEHALSCREPSPVACSGFRSMLTEVLPVRR